MLRKLIITVMAVQVIIRTANILLTYACTIIIILWTVLKTFFPTSHGKSPCDGIGRTLTWLTTRASLQRPFLNQILIARQVFEFCQKDVCSINVLFVSQRDIEDA